jgi:hypothetical protein
MANYYYIEDKDIDKIVKALRLHKHLNGELLIESLNYQLKKSKNQNPKYRLAAKNLLSKLDNKMYSNDELFIDEDALVSEDTQGAYVQCWLWVNNDTKTRKPRKNQA